MCTFQQRSAIAYGSRHIGSARLQQLYMFLPSGLLLSFCAASQAVGIHRVLGIGTKAWTGLDHSTIDPIVSNFGVAWDESIFGFRFPLIFQIRCQKGLHRWHGGSPCRAKGVQRWMLTGSLQDFQSPIRGRNDALGLRSVNTIFHHHD